MQAALNAARPGDTILLQPGATFTGNFVLPAKCGSSYITIRSAADDSLLPGPGARMTPAFAARLPKIRRQRSGAGNRDGRDILATAVSRASSSAGIPHGEPARAGQHGGDQSAMSMVAVYLVVDRCYIHGDAVQGQRRGIALNSADTQVVKLVLLGFQRRSAGYASPGRVEWPGAVFDREQLHRSWPAKTSSSAAATRVFSGSCPATSRFAET